GAVTTHVIHRSTTDWTIGAGPYEVHVVGTRFEVKWNAEGGSLDVHVIEGAVKLTGPSEALVRAPQTLHVQTRVAAAASAPPSAEVVLAPEALAPATASQIAPAPSSQKPAAPQWPALVGDGRFDAVVADAQREGEGDALARRPARDLAALADAARYTGN